MTTKRMAAAVMPAEPAVTGLTLEMIPSDLVDYK
jgi:hypothetical protein